MMLNRFLYTSYRLFFIFRQWRHRHITRTGALIISIIILSGLFGFNIFRTTLYQVFSLASVMTIISLIFSIVPFRSQIKIKRLLPDLTSVCDPVVYEIELTNLSKKHLKGLVLFEDIKDPRPDFKTLTTLKEPYEKDRNAWDKRTLYYRWSWLIQKNKKASFSFIKLPDLPPDEPVRIKVKTIPQHRGYLYFTGATLARPDIFGLFNRIYQVKKAQKLLILPRRYALKPPLLFSSRQYHPGGINLVSAIGNSNEFMALRKYRPGDPLKNIHWRTFAKTQELVIKEFEDEFFVRHALILDTFLPDENEFVFEQAISIASSYIHTLQTHESILDLMFVGNQLYSFSSGRGLSHTERMLEIMASVQPCKHKQIQDLIPLIKTRIKQLSGSICIFLAWSDDHQKMVQLFEQTGIPLFIILVTDDPHSMRQIIPAQTHDHIQIKIVNSNQIESELGEA